MKILSKRELYYLKKEVKLEKARATQPQIFHKI